MTIEWKNVADYQNKGDGLSVDSEPLVLLYKKRSGLALGRVIRFDDGEVRTFASGYHGFVFDKYAHVEEPDK